MQKYLILWAMFTLLSIGILSAQTPYVIELPPSVKAQLSSQKDLPCNFAGTFQLGQFIGQSNDVNLDTIFLCQGDSIFIQHNGDFDLSGDPDPSTPAGIAYAFYNCPPTIAGDDIQSILTDPCLIPSPAAPNFLATNPNTTGSTWFFNNGTLQTLFNMGNPLMLHFAPITVDNLSVTDAYEGNPPGPCVNVNVAERFAVVYLNAISVSGVTSSYNGYDCLGYFTIRGGLPQYLSSARYDINIYLQSDPTVRGIIHVPTSTYTHLGVILFTAPVPGTYVIEIEDGKSCGHTFLMDMSGCNPADEATLIAPQTTVPPGQSICVPITVNNFSDITTLNFSMQWDPTVISYTGFQNPNPLLGVFDPSYVNTGLVNQGIVGISAGNLTGQPFNLQDGDPVIEFCFQAVGQLGDCTPLDFINTPTFLSVENSQGEFAALNILNGEICIEFAPLEFTYQILYPDCPNAASQSNVNVTVTGGQPPYEVVIRRLPSGPTFTFPTIQQDGGMLVSGGLPDGVYTICVTDGNGLGQEVCDTITIDLGSQPTLGVSLDLISPTCFGFSDGAVNAQVTLGGINIIDPAANGYSFVWAPTTVPSPNGATQSDVPGGLYAVTVTETATGCTAVASGTLGQPSALVLQNPNITPASCNGIDDGQIIQGATGGTQFPGGGYNFNWTYCATPDCSGPNEPIQEIIGIDQPFTLANRIAGYYTAVVSDANGCSLTTQPIQIVNVRQLFVNLDAVFGPTCNGLADGRLCISATELPAFPTPDYTFFWSGPVDGVSTNNTPNATCYEQLIPGTYTVFASDNNFGCFEIAEFTVPETPQLVLSELSLTQPSCILPNGGSISVIATGGTGGPLGYQYIWNGGFTGPTRSNVGPGDYFVTVTDVNGCQDSLTFTLNSPPPADIASTMVTPIVCGDDGCLEVVAPSGASYAWVNLTTGATLADTTAKVCGLAPGSYSVTVTDIAGCQDSTTLMLAPPANPPLSIVDTVLTNPSCFGYTDGQISINVQGGNIPIASFVWSNNQMGSVLQDAPAGTYTLTITDALGCTLVESYTLDEPPGISVTFTDIQKARCNNTCDGQAIVEAQYNTNPPTAGTFSFVWDNGFAGANNTTLCPGWNKVITTDPNFCFREDSIFITGAPMITAALSTLPVDCNGESTGSRATAIGGGGNGAPFSYSWSNGQMTPTIGNIPAGPYSVTISDNQNCTEVFSVTVTEPDPIVVQQDPLATVNIECFGDEDGALGVVASGGNPGPYSFVWQDASGNVIGNTAAVTDLKAGTYTVLVTDIKGCPGQITLTLTNPAPVLGSYEPWEPLLCNGDLTRLIIQSISGGSGGPYQYSLDFGPKLSADFPIDLNGGTHFITYFDGRDCSFTDTIFVFEPDPFVVTFDPNVLELELGDSLRLNPIITGSTADMFVWSPVDGLLNPNSLTPTVYTFTNTTYTLSVQDANGCTATGSVRLEIDPNRNVYFPNAFIPNNPKGLNTHFNVYTGLGVEQVNFMQVYDRWGTLVYERRNFLPNNDVFNEGWDGRYRGKYVNPDVFVYIAEIKFLDGRTLVYRGDVTVVR